MQRQDGSVVVTGASGFIGSRLGNELVRRGYPVRAMTRHPDRYQGAGTAVFGDVEEPESLRPVLAEARAAYYLVHSLDADDFEARDAAAATNFARAAAAAGIPRLIYLGGLGAEHGNLSPHLRSRRQVERLLTGTGVPVTVLRAAVVIGHGGISWEIVRQLVEHLPAVVTPRWVHTRTQPIALSDVIRYLVGVLESQRCAGTVYEIGGPEVLTYLDMMRRTAAVLGRQLPNLSVPLLTPRLSSAWLALVTDVDFRTARNLVDSLRTEVIVTDPRIREAVPGDLLGFDDAVRIALADREAALATSRAPRSSSR